MIGTRQQIDLERIAVKYRIGDELIAETLDHFVCASLLAARIRANLFGHAVRLIERIDCAECPACTVKCFGCQLSQCANTILVSKLKVDIALLQLL